MSEKFKFPSGWRALSIEDRGLLLTLAAGSGKLVWRVDDIGALLQVEESRAAAFVETAKRIGVLSQPSDGCIKLVECSGDAALRKWWERQFDEVFWPAVTAPWKKLGKANAQKVWRGSVFALIAPKTEESAAALLKEIMEGVEIYKRLLLQPNAPSMKYPEGWLSGHRWRDEIDEQFIEQHAAVQTPASLSPLERGRRQQSQGQRTLFDKVVTVPVPLKQIAAPILETSNEQALPDFNVAL